MWRRGEKLIFSVRQTEKLGRNCGKGLLLRSGIRKPCRARTDGLRGRGGSSEKRGATTRRAGGRTVCRPVTCVRRHGVAVLRYVEVRSWVRVWKFINYYPHGRRRTFAGTYVSNKNKSEKCLDRKNRWRERYPDNNCTHGIWVFSLPVWREDK